MKPNIDPNKAREAALVSLRRKAFVANGGHIQEVPTGASALSPTMSQEDVRQFTWRNTQRKKAEARKR